jgi:hypothetical protein
LQNHCLLAEHLLNNGLHEEAGKLLEDSLREHSYSTGLIRRRNGRWVSVARKLQKRVGAR